MGVITEADNTLTHPMSRSEVTGAPVMEVIKVISIAAADSDTSTFLIAELPDIAILESLTFEGDAITGGSDYDIGIFDVDGNVVDVNVLADGLDFSSTSGLPTGPLGSPIRQVLTSLGVANAGKMLFELAGHVNKAFPASGETSRKSRYRIVLTCNTIGSAAATLVARTRYLKGGV